MAVSDWKVFALVGGAVVFVYGLVLPAIRDVGKAPEPTAEEPVRAEPVRAEPEPVRHRPEVTVSEPKLRPGIPAVEVTAVDVGELGGRAPDPATPVWSPDGRRLAWRVGPRRGEELRITTDPGGADAVTVRVDPTGEDHESVGAPAWLPGSDGVVYTSGRVRRPGRLYEARAPSWSPERVVPASFPSSSESEPDVGPDGAVLFAYEGLEGPGLARRDRRGSIRHIGPFGFPTIAPRGDRAVLFRMHEGRTFSDWPMTLDLIDLDSGNVRTLGPAALYPRWVGPDRLVVVGETLLSWRIGDEAPTVLVEDAVPQPPGVSRDGRYVAWTDAKGEGRAVYVTDLRAARVVAVVLPHGRVEAPAVGIRGGRVWLAFVGEHPLSREEVLAVADITKAVGG